MARFSGLSRGPELYEALPCFSADIVFIVVEYSQLPRLPPDLDGELRFKTNALYQLLNLAARDRRCLSNYYGGMDFNATTNTWVFAHFRIGTKNIFASRPEWVVQNSETGYQVESEEYRCPMWLWRSYKAELKTQGILTVPIRVKPKKIGQ